MAGVLHVFYGGVENCFKRIARGNDEPPPSGPDSHAALLEQMTRAAPGRSAVINAALAGRLKEFMRFRHFFRHAYSFHLDWAKMAPLVAVLGETADEVDRQLRAALAISGPEAQ